MDHLGKEILHGITKAGAEYADIRVVAKQSETILVQDEKVMSIDSRTSKGFGVRVLKDGAWGYYGMSGELGEGTGQTAARRALAISTASALAGKDLPVKLTPPSPFHGRWSSPVHLDPFDVKLEDKINHLKHATRLALAVPSVKAVEASLEFFTNTTQFLSTEGVSFEQTLTESGGGISVWAAHGTDSQRRSYPNSNGSSFQAGYEAVLNIDLPGNAEACARSAVELAKAPACPEKVTDLILCGSQLQMQIHESCGHAFELDRILGSEAGSWGASFLRPGDQGTYQYGSTKCNLTADATVPGGLGTFRWDDEGVRGQRVPLVREGVVSQFLSSRETASELGLGGSAGSMRAEGWECMPLVRMTNINLEPGDWSKEEMIRDTQDGILMETAKTWSIDENRWDFQMGSEIGWLIENGSIKGPVKNPTYRGVTPEFWGSLDAVAGVDEWKLYNMTNCGKGEPGQNIHIGHGAAPARFRRVKVGV